MSTDCISGGHPPRWWDHHKTLIFSIEHFARRKGFDPTAEIKMFDDKKLSSLDCDIDIRGLMDWGRHGAGLDVGPHREIFTDVAELPAPRI